MDLPEWEKTVDFAQLSALVTPRRSPAAASGTLWNSHMLDVLSAYTSPIQTRNLHITLQQQTHALKRSDVAVAQSSAAQAQAQEHESRKSQSGDALK